MPMNYAVLVTVPLLTVFSILGYSSFSQENEAQQPNKLKAAYSEYQLATANMKESEKDFSAIWKSNLAVDGLTLADFELLLKKAETNSKERIYKNENALQLVNWKQFDVNKNGVVTKDEYKKGISAYKWDEKTGKKIKSTPDDFESLIRHALNQFSIWDEDSDGNLDPVEQEQYAAHERKTKLKPTQFDSAEVQSFVKFMTTLIEMEPSGDKALSKAEFDLMMSELQN
jgi:hypothetical protein